MEAQSDNSRSMSDSGGVIDLSAVDSGSPGSKTGDSSLDNSSNRGSGKKDGGGKRTRQPSGESWLTDMDTRMKDMKLIEEEEFDFDIPQEYLDISLEVEEPSHGGMEEDSLSPACVLPKERKEQLLVQYEEEDCVSSGQRGPATIDESNMNVNSFPREFNPQPLCVLDCELEPVDVRGEGGDMDVFVQSQQAGSGQLANGDLIAFTSWMASQGSADSAVDGEQVSSGSPALEPATEEGEAVSQTDSLGKTDSMVASESSESESVLAASRSNESVTGSVNRSRLQTPSKQLRKCSIFNSSPVRCSKLEELREVSQAVKLSSLECSSIQNLQQQDTTILSSSQLAHGSKLEGAQDVPQAVDLLRAETFVVRSEDDSTTVPISSSSSANTSIACSSSSLSCGGSVSNSSTELCESGGSGNRETGGESLEDSGSSSQSRSSSGSGVSRGSQGSLGGRGYREQGLVGGSKIARARSKSRLVKPGSKVSSIPSKSSSSTAIPAAKVPRKVASKPSLLPTADRGSQLPMLQSRLAQGRNNRTSSRPKGGENGPISTKPVKAVGGLKMAALRKPSVKTAKGPQLNGCTSKLNAPLSRRNSNIPAITNGEESTNYPSKPSKEPSLSTSMVSTGSPSMKQSTPIEQEPQRLLTTPNNSPTDLQQPTFSLSAIESSTVSPNGRQLVAPHTNETYMLAQAGPGEGPQAAAQVTPKTETKRKRRSFIPTPGGQDRAKSRYASPVPYNIDTPNDATYSKASKEAGLGHSPTSRGTPKGLTKAMPPPKTRRALKPRASGLQRPWPARSQGAVLGPRNGRRLKAEGPIKANQPFAFGGFDYDFEAPIPHAKVVHSPINKENRPATPHSEWSPVKKRRPISKEDACIQCTKHTKN